MVAACRLWRLGHWLPFDQLSPLRNFIVANLRSVPTARTIGIGSASGDFIVCRLRHGRVARWLDRQSKLAVGRPVFRFSARLLLSEAFNIRCLIFGLACASLATLSKESGSGSLLMALFILAYRNRTDFDANARKTSGGGVIAAAVLLMIWAGYLVLGGYGTNSLFYATPWSDPLRFGNNLLALSTVGAVSFIAPFPLDTVALFPASRLPLAAIFAVIVIAFAPFFVRSLPKTPAVGFLCIWAVLFLGLQAGGLPSDRLLFVPAIGVMGILSLFFDERLFGPNTPTQGIWTTRLTSLIWISATFLSGSAILMQSIGLSMGSNYLLDRVQTSNLGPPESGYRNILVLQSESQMQAFTFSPMWAHECDDHELMIWYIQIGKPTTLMDPSR